MLRSEALHQVLLHPPLPPLLRHPCAHHFLPQRLHHLCGILSTKKNFECYETSSKLRTNFVRCETLITNLSPTTNGSPWQPVSSCRPSCSSNSSYRPSCPSSGQQLVSQCRKRLSCPSFPLQSHLTNNTKSKLHLGFHIFFQSSPNSIQGGDLPWSCCSSPRPRLSPPVQGFL